MKREEIAPLFLLLAVAVAEPPKPLYTTEPSAAVDLAPPVAEAVVDVVALIRVGF